MRSVFKNYGFIIFFVIAIVHLAAILLHQDELRSISKPLLLPVLALTVYASTSAGKQRGVFLVALVFSFLGDVLLMFEHLNALYFIFGLVSFLIAHLLYILFFMRIRKQDPAGSQVSIIVIAFVIAYGLSLVLFLWPSLGDLKIPVAIYAMVICSMLLSSVAVLKLVSLSAAKDFLTGALLFVASDSILALNKFYQPFPWAAVLIMLTYILAQYFLTRGFIHYQSSSTRTSIQ